MTPEYMPSRKKRKLSTRVRNTSKKDTRPQVPRKTPQKKLQKKKMDEIELLLLGSSIIHQWNPSILPDAPMPLHITNLGINGLTTKQMHSNLETILQPLSETYEPNVILFYCGSNDISHPQQSDNKQILENTEQILQQLQDHFPNSLVVYLSILKCPGRSKFSAQIENLNHSIRNFSKKARSGKKGTSRIQYVDLNPEIRANPDFFLQDGVHLNETGYQKINLILLKQIF